MKTRSISSVICGNGLRVVETGQVCTDGHLRVENSDGIRHVMKYPQNKNAYLHKPSVV